MNCKDRAIYLDNNATTPLDPVVLQAMMPYLTTDYGNAASHSHAFGWEAKKAVEKARKVIAAAINAPNPADIIFTSGATESINLALSLPENSGHVITSTIEHKAGLDSCARLNSRGIDVSLLAPQLDGVVSPEAVSRAIRDDTRLVSIMSANNEIGTLQKIEEIGEICQRCNIPFHTDATQALGKVAFDVQKGGISLASFSAHKVYGPKGVGALYINSSNPTIRLSPLLIGGGHERGLRSGTLNVPGIVGFARAVELAVDNMPEETARIRALRDMLCQYILNEIPEVKFNGNQHESLPGLLNVSFAGIDADSLLLELSEFALSSGSACTSAQRAPSHVLQAIGVSDSLSQASIRFGLGRFNHEDEIRYLCQRLGEAVKSLRAMTPASFHIPKTYQER